MKLAEILQDIHGLEAKLQELEKQYSILSQDFYILHQLGEIEQSRDMIRWVGYYELRQARQQSYQVALRERLVALRQSQMGHSLTLQPVFAS